MAGNTWPGVAKEQHERFSLPIVATNVYPQHRLRGISSGLLLLFDQSRALTDRIAKIREKPATIRDKVDATT